jgi:hypothetical protein
VSSQTWLLVTLFSRQFLQLVTNALGFLACTQTTAPLPDFVFLCQFGLSTLLVLLFSSYIVCCERVRVSAPHRWSALHALHVVSIANTLTHVRAFTYDHCALHNIFKDWGVRIAYSCGARAESEHKSNKKHCCVRYNAVM